MGKRRSRASSQVAADNDRINRAALQSQLDEVLAKLRRAEAREHDAEMWAERERAETLRLLDSQNQQTTQMPAMQPSTWSPYSLPVSGMSDVMAGYQSTRPVCAELPMPRQATYDGKAPWETFIRPFESLAARYVWDEEERLFRLTSSLRGDASQYVYCQIPYEKAMVYGDLVQALESRFQDRRPPSSYLRQLEGRRLQPNEDVSSFIASIRELVIKGYPTADQATRETIELRHFLKGLPNPEMVLAVGMCDPKTIDEAQICVNTYTSLQDDAVRPPQVKAVQVSPYETNDSYVTKSHMHKMLSIYCTDFDYVTFITQFNF